MKFEMISEKEAPTPRVYYQHEAWPNKEELYDMYWNKKMNQKQISKETGYARITISQIMDEYDIPTRSVSDARKGISKYSINKNFFETWSHEMAYTLGLFCADGNIVKNLKQLKFDSTDKEILESIRDIMQSNHPIIKDKRYDGYYYQISSIEIVEDLLNLGITPNKSLTLEFPDVPEEFMSSFVRGEFDGDGSVYPIKGQNSIYVDITSASDNFTLKLQSVLSDNGIKASLKRLDGELLGVYIWKRSHKKFYDFIYSTPGPYLKRKKDIFDKFFGGENAR